MSSPSFISFNCLFVCLFFCIFELFQLSLFLFFYIYWIQNCCCPHWCLRIVKSCHSVFDFFLHVRECLCIGLLTSLINSGISVGFGELIAFLTNPITFSSLSITNLGAFFKPYQLKDVRWAPLLIFNSIKPIRNFTQWCCIT